MAKVLSDRALNRALLARQHLLRRAAMPALGMIEHLAGLQAQAPLASYVGLWSRLTRFDPAELSDLLTSRAAVRANLMRATVHLVSARDARGMQRLTAPVLRAGLQGHFGRWMQTMDVAAVVEAGQKLLAEQPRTRAQMRDLLAERWPDQDADTLAYTVSYLAGTVHVTPRGVWGSTGPAAMTTLENWLGPVKVGEDQLTIDDLVLRYLAAFGPATVLDIQLWSGLTRLREVVERQDLRVFKNDQDRELFDVPDGVRPDERTPAPVRFLPEFDNVLLSHADRTRIVEKGRPVPLPPGNGARIGTVLVDGFYEGDWRITIPRGQDDATLTVTPLRPLTSAERADVTSEGARLLAFVAPGARHDVRIVAP